MIAVVFVHVNLLTFACNSRNCCEVLCCACNFIQLWHRRATRSVCKHFGGWSMARIADWHGFVPIDTCYVLEFVELDGGNRELRRV